MAREVVSCTVEDDLVSAAQLMRQNRTRQLPVINRDGTLVGLLSLDDLACEAARALRGGLNDELRDLVLEVHLSISNGHLLLHPAAVPLVVPPTELPQPSQSPSSRIRVCAQCGTRAPANSKFCAECGLAINPMGGAAAG